jgi:hypothetical protein
MLGGEAQEWSKSLEWSESGFLERCVRYANKKLVIKCHPELESFFPFGYGWVLAYSALSTAAPVLSTQVRVHVWLILAFSRRTFGSRFLPKNKVSELSLVLLFKYTVYSTNLPSSSYLGLNLSSKCSSFWCSWSDNHLMDVLAWFGYILNMKVGKKKNIILLYS